MEIRERVKGKQFRHKLISFLVQVTGWKRILKLDIIHMRRKKGGVGGGGRGGGGGGGGSPQLFERGGGNITFAPLHPPQ